MLPALALALVTSFVPGQSAVAVPAASSTVVSGAPANLVTNGSFENPAIWQTDGVVEYGAGSTVMPGWTVEAGSIDLVGSTYWGPQDGHQSLDLAGSSSGSVEQKVSTKPGQAYALTWYMAGNTNCGQAVKAMQVRWDGTVIDSPEFDATGFSNTDMGWTQQEIYVTATSATSTLDFADVTLDDSQCGTALDNVALVPATISKPAFRTEDAVLKTLAGAPYSAAFFAVGVPSYSLAGAPSWLSVNAYGAVTGTPPAGAKSFTYSVKASNADGSAVAGPYTVAVEKAAQISGAVTDGGIANTPVAGAIVQACVTGGGQCLQTTTASDGTYSVPAPIGGTVVVSAYPLPGSGDITTSTDPLTVPGGGITGETISLSGITPLPNGVTVNGTTAPTVFWANPATISTHGCANGFGGVSVVGQNTQTGDWESLVLPLTETPVGSGTYTGVIPPLEPVHGPVEINASVSCSPQTPIVPYSGPATGGTTVAISGSGFTGATRVTFGGVPVKSFTVATDEVIDAVAPPGNGEVSVSVQNGGKSTAVGQYTYMAVQSVSPSGGPASGGTHVVIHGTGLGSAQAVYFGSVAVPFTQVSNTEIDATSPPGTGTVDITVQTLSDQTTAIGSEDKFTYGSGPAGRGGKAAVRRAASGAALATRAAQPPTPPAPADALSVCSPEEITNLFEQISQCVGNAIGNTAYNVVQVAIAAAVAKIAPPDCKTSADAWAAAAQAAAQPYINRALAALDRAAAPLALEILEAAFLAGGPALAFLAAAAGLMVAAAVYVLVQFAANMLIQAAVEKAYASLQCPPGTPGYKAWHGNAKIDPSGTVLDSNGHPVKGAKVTILRADTAAGPFMPESAASPDIDPNVDPETTGADGVFHWDVVAGWYEVSASASKCHAPSDPYQSTVTIGPYPVPPPQLGLTLTLACAGEAPALAPAVSSLSVSTGVPRGGTKVTVLGRNFTPASKVTFGKVAATAVTYLSAQAIQVTSPAGSGLVDVRVKTQGGTSRLTRADKFFFGAVPLVRKISPESGPDTGGSAVTITGTHFTGITAVTFGGVPAVSFRVKSSTSIQVVAPSGVPGTCDVQVVNPAGVSTVVKAGTFRYREVTAYVVTASGVVPVNPATGQSGHTIAVRGATEVAITPNGSTAYVVSRATGTVTPVRLPTGKPGKAIKVGQRPDAIAITPNGSTAYVVNGGSGTVTPVRLSTGKPAGAIKVGQRPDAIAITPNGSTAYVVNGRSGTVTPIKLATAKAEKPIKVAARIVAIAITPNGKTAYVASSAGTVTPIALATGKLGKAIKAGSGPAAIALSPSGSTLYVADFGTAKTRGNAVTPIHLPTGKAGRAIKAGTGPDSIAITPGGLFAFVADFYSARMTQIRLSTGAASTTVKVGAKPVSIAVTP